VTHEDLQWVLTAVTTPLGGLHLVKDCHQRRGQVQLGSGFNGEFGARHCADEDDTVG
jgi:hypothetical protein